MMRSILTTTLITLISVAGTYGQNRGGPPASPLSPRAAARIDITGYWVSLITEDWRYRQFTPPKGDYQSVPLNAAGKKIADAWDPAKDEAAGQQCKAYGAAGLMRVPGRIRISWENDTTLKIETEAGTQTRHLQFIPPTQQPAAAPPSLQGQSVASWELVGGRGAARAGNMKVVTRNLSGGYLRKNGVPYSPNAV